MTLGKESTFIEFMDDTEKVAFFRDYYTATARLALSRGFGFLLESAATWKASQDRAVNTLGLSVDKWQQLMASSNSMMADIRQRLQSEFPNRDIAIGGVIGARSVNFEFGGLF